MKIITTQSFNGGFNEGKKINPNLNQRSFKNDIWVFDSGTSNITINPIRIFMGVWAAMTFPNLKIVSLYPSNKGLTERTASFELLADKLGININLSVIKFSELVSGHTLTELPERKALGELFCPHCNKQHILRIDGGDIICTSLRSIEKICDFNAGNDITNLIENFGFKAFFPCLSLAINQIPSSTHLVVRDYSNPHGTVGNMINQYGERVSVSTRLYIKDKNNEEISFSKFLSFVDRKILNDDLFEKVPFLSDGTVVEIIM